MENEIRTSGEEEPQPNKISYSQNDSLKFELFGFMIFVHNLDQDITFQFDYFDLRKCIPNLTDHQYDQIETLLKYRKPAVVDMRTGIVSRIQSKPLKEIGDLLMEGVYRDCIPNPESLHEKLLDTVEGEARRAAQELIDNQLIKENDKNVR